MRTTELSPADYILLWEDKYERGIYRVDSLHFTTAQENGSLSLSSPERLQIGVSPNLVFPLPISPRFLRENGFTESEDENYFSFSPAEDDLIFISDDTFYYYPTARTARQDASTASIGSRAEYILPCSWVHELQHALRLCGYSEKADNLTVYKTLFPTSIFPKAPF